MTLEEDAGTGVDIHTPATKERIVEACERAAASVSGWVIGGSEKPKIAFATGPTIKGLNAPSDRVLFKIVGPSVRFEVLIAQSDSTNTRVQTKLLEYYTRQPLTFLIPTGRKRIEGLSDYQKFNSALEAELASASGE